MKLKCIGTGSTGNCFLLDVDGKILLLDAGVSIREIKAALDFDFSNVIGAVVTHHHKDHSKAVDDLRRMGVFVYTPYEELVPHDFGDITITVVPLRDKEDKWLHTNGDGTECPIFGYIIDHCGDRLAYFTDFLYLPYTFRSWAINTLLIACNHEDDAEYESEAQSYHSHLGHSNLSTVAELIKVNQTASLNQVILCHLSQMANGDLMREKVLSTVSPGVRVFVAKDGEEYDLREIPF